MNLNNMHSFDFSYKRIIIFGTSGVGKTNLADQLASRYSLPLIDMDGLFRAAKNTEAPLETFTRQVNAAIQGEFWIMDGSYTELQSITWPRAEAIVWLDFPRPIVIWGLLKRSIWRIFFRKGINIDSGEAEERSSALNRTRTYLLNILTHYRRQQSYFLRLYNTRYGRAHIIRLRSYKEAEQWVKSCVALASHTNSVTPRFELA